MSDKRYQEEYLRRIHKVQDYIEQHTGDYHSMNLYNGTAVLNIALPENANVGDRFNYTCIITDTMVEKEFCESFEIVVEEKKEDNGGNGGHRNPRILWQDYLEDYFILIMMKNGYIRKSSRVYNICKYYE